MLSSEIMGLRRLHAFYFFSSLDGVLQKIRRDIIPGINFAGTITRFRRTLDVIQRLLDTCDSERVLQE